MACPNCAGTAAKTLVLTVDVQLPDNPAKRLRVLHCPDCTAHFYDSQVPPDYAEPALNNRGRVPFYVQQGAGVSLITRPLAQLKRGPGASYMEVGCGYGFGLDFALNTKGWTGIGIDPAPLADLGRQALSLPIELRYLRDDDEARGTIDVVLGSEVIEHVTSPAAFVRTLKAMLKPGGVMVLTTPNGDDIDPGTPPGIIIPLLSPSLHLVIQNRRSLRALLERAGFRHVEVEIDSHSLVAFASDAPLELEHGHEPLRRALREHLERRANIVEPGSDLFVAFAGRAFYESVNDGDMEAADRAWAMLVPGVQGAVRAVAGRDLGVAAAGRELRVGGDGDAGAAEPRGPAVCAGDPAAGGRDAAVGAGGAVPAGGRGGGADASGAGRAGDGGRADRGYRLDGAGGGTAVRRRCGGCRVGRAAGAVAAGAERGRGAAAVDRAAGGVEPGQCREVRGGAGAGAGPAAGSGAVRAAGFGAVGGGAGRAVCACRAGCGDRGDGRAVGIPAAARARFKRVRQAAEPGGGLWWSALRGEAQAMGLLGDQDGMADLAERVVAEHPKVDAAHWAVTTLVNAGRYEPARAVAKRAGLPAAAFSQPGSARPLTDAERDLVFCLAVLDVQTGLGGRWLGEPAMARGRFARVRKAVTAGSGLWWAALRGELQALDMLDALDEAATLTQEVTSANPELAFPQDILSRIGKG